jgi:excisionase family DNA binding protein
MTDNLLTVKQAATRTGKSVSTVRAWIRDGRLPANRSGTAKNAAVMVSEGELLGLLREQGLLDTPQPVSDTQTDKLTDNQLLTAVMSERDRLLRELDSERSYYRAELARVQTELASVRSELDSTRKALVELARQAERQQGEIARLEQEKAAAESRRGIRGLLKGFIG